MALACAARARGRGARIADFWRFSAVFWLHTGIRIPWRADRKTRAFVRGSWPAGHRITARCRRDLPAGCRIEGRGSRIAARGSRITAGDLLAGMFGTKSAGRGSAALTLLMAQCWPVAGIRKPAGMLPPAGVLLACARLIRRS